MALKIITDINIVSAINQAASEKENNPQTKYCEIKKHPIRDEWAVPIIEGILVSYDLPFINYLLEDNIETLPPDWIWLFPERSIRVTIPMKLQSKALITKFKKKDTSDLALLGELLNTMLPIIPDFIYTNEKVIYIYLEELYTKHEAILRTFDEITIEYK